MKVYGLKKLDKFSRSLKYSVSSSCSVNSFIPVSFAAAVVVMVYLVNHVLRKEEAGQWCHDRS